MESVYFPMFKSLMEMVELSNDSVVFQEYLSGVKVCLESLRSTEVLFAGNTKALSQNVV